MGALPERECDVEAADDVAVRLVHTTQVATNGPVDGSTLANVRTPDDGVYDELNIQRDEYGADLVALIVDNPGGSACGIAYLMNPIGTGFASNAVSVTDLGCATGNFSFLPGSLPIPFFPITTERFGYA